MRTTLTLDDDVAARLKQLDGFSSFKEAVNATLRAGLAQLDAEAEPKAEKYRLQTVALEPLIHNVDNIAEILDLIEEKDEFAPDRCQYPAVCKSLKLCSTSSCYRLVRTASQ